jgi:predicted TIM-barrel fold metal-dependent hydrolase
MPGMIVDCHTHIWQSPEQLGSMALGERASGRDRAPPSPAACPAGDAEHHWSQAAPLDHVVVLGFRSRAARAAISNRYIAEYVARDPRKLVGFAGIDPTEPQALEELRRARANLQLRGLVLCPAAQDFHPADTRAMRLYELAAELDMPILFHAAPPGVAGARLEFAQPYLLDEVARTFPGLRIIIGQMGRPWIDQTVHLLECHPLLLADIAGLLERPWQAYQALVGAHQAGIIDKLLFGSDFPYGSAHQVIEQLYSLNQMVQGTNLPVVPREALRGIVERDALKLLGIAP